MRIRDLSREIAQASGGSAYDDSSIDKEENGFAKEDVHQVGSGPQGLAYERNGRLEIYNSSNTRGTDDLTHNMGYIRSQGGTNVRIMLPGPSK